MQYESGDDAMDDGQIRKIKEVKETINGLESAALLEVLLYIDELVKNYEDQHKA